MYRKNLLYLCLITTLAACAPSIQPTVEAEPTLTSFQPVPNTPTITATATSTPVMPTATFTATATAIPTPPVPEQYLPYTIDHLRTRSYGEGQLEVMEVIEETEAFTRYSMRYPSDGLDIYGFMNVPKGEGPFPVMITLHGYANSGVETLTGYTTEMADVFAEHGYLVLNSNMRGYPPSDNGDDLFRVGLAIDVLNLIALIKEPDSPIAELANVDLTRMGMFGQSLGGEVALRVATINQDVKAVGLYSALSGDELKNAELMYGITKEQTNLTELKTPVEVMYYISPLYYFDKITANVLLLNGTSDDIVPPAWAVENCDALKANSVDVECKSYLNAEHLLFDQYREEATKDVLDFFDSQLAQP